MKGSNIRYFMTFRMHSHHKGNLPRVAICSIAAACAAWGAALPLAFEPNRGQASGDFVARGGGFTVELESHRIDLFARVRLKGLQNFTSGGILGRDSHVLILPTSSTHPAAPPGRESRRASSRPET